jgi:hypothetical protein
VVDLDEFLERPLLAHIASGSEGGARNSLFWYLWEEGALWVILEEGFNTIGGRVRNDPRVAVGLADFDPRTGKLEHVSIRGTASLEPWDDARASRLLRRYYRHLKGYRERPATGDEKVRGRLPMTFLKVVPDSVVIRGHSYAEQVRKQ